MGKLSEKDQEWLDDIATDSAHLFCTAVEADNVRMYLIQKDAEHKAEIDALKAEHYKSICDWRKSFDRMHQRAMHSEQSLAQHDKQVKIDTIVHFCAWLVDNGEPIAEEQLQVIGSKYINQIKEQL